MRQKWLGGEICLHLYKFKGVFCPDKDFMVMSVKEDIYKSFKYIELCCFCNSFCGGFDWSLCGGFHFTVAKWPAGCAD